MFPNNQVIKGKNNPNVSWLCKCLYTTAEFCMDSTVSLCKSNSLDADVHMSKHKHPKTKNNSP